MKTFINYCENVKNTEIRRQWKWNIKEKFRDVKLLVRSSSAETRKNLVEIPSLNTYLCLESGVRASIEQTQLYDI